MAANKVGSSATAEQKHVVVTRVFDAPRELVFEAWTTPEHLARWWGPRGFTLPFCDMDFRPGGSFRECMRSPEGRDYWCKGLYREVVPPERIVYTSNLEEEPDNEALTTVTFTERAGKTEVRLEQILTVTALTQGVEQGWNETIDRLITYLQQQPKEQSL